MHSSQQGDRWARDVLVAEGPIGETVLWLDGLLLVVHEIVELSYQNGA